MSFKRLILCLIASFTILVILPDDKISTIESASNAVSWQQANIPSQGAEHGWLLANGSDITCLASDSRGILYAGVTGLSSNLYKSSDDGKSWQSVGSDTDTIIDMVVADDDTLYSATPYQIYKCINDPNRIVASLSSRLTDPDTVISSIDVSPYNGGYAILVGTKNQNNGQFGGVYVIYGDVLMQWQDLGLAGCDVYSVAFSPQFQQDNCIIALANDETHTFVTWKAGSGNWSGTIANAELKDGSTGNALAEIQSAEIAFPDNYSSDLYSGNCVLYAALDTGTNEGDVYTVYGRHNPEQSIAEDLDIASSYGQSSVDINSFDICGSLGDIYMMAGSSSGGHIYTSSDNGNTWQQSKKPPTGGQVTAVLMPFDYQNNGKAYSATGGSGSAFSVSYDYGINWNQFSLIDTTLDVLIEVTVSPDYDNDQTVFLLGWGNEYSVWRSTDGCESWQRVFSGASGSFVGIDKIALSPIYGDERNVLYMCGSENGNPTLWKSEDNGQSFIARGMPFAADCWEIIDDTSFYVAGFDGSDALFYRTVDSGAHYKYKSIVGNQPLSSITLSPNYLSDSTVLAGNCNGGVDISTDEGVTFSPLGNISSPLAGSVSVAFDADFESNKTVYAAGDMTDNGIYRFIIGESSVWEAIDSTLPSGAMVGKLGVSGNGVLYAANFQQASAGGGIERCINPSSSHLFETFNNGLYDDSTLTDICLSGNSVWSIDTTHNSLLIFKDTLSEQLSLISPADKSTVKAAVSDGEIEDILLDWEAPEGATGYRWQLSDSPNFFPSSIIAEDTTSAGSVRVDSLETGSEYYWRIRSITPLLSPWSETWSFTPRAIIEPDAPVLVSPSAGAVNIPVNAMFQWTAVEGAHSYELEISTRHDFSSPVISLTETAALPVNAWQNTDDFAYDTTYYWRVRAVNADVTGGWSGVGVFSTGVGNTTQTSVSTDTVQPNPTQTLTSYTTVEKVATTVSTQYQTLTVTQTSQTIVPVAQSAVIPDWLYYSFGFMAFLIVVLLAAILIIVIKRR
jgi:hypothetical protein